MPRSQPDPPPVPLSRYRNGYVADCENSVARFRRIVSAIPPSPARDWLGTIAGQLDGELGAVRRLATVGDSIEPARFRIREAPAKRIARRLDDTRISFSAAVTQAATIAEQAALDPAHADVTAQLEILAQQASELALGPAPGPPVPDEPARPWYRRRGPD
ncbi:MAG: hypothetical protein OJJ54_00370 [Pseudonocardia sp.]|nr:hypothetical protein [Pseudonocardia sp.]